MNIPSLSNKHVIDFFSVKKCLLKKKNYWKKGKVQVNMKRSSPSFFLDVLFPFIPVLFVVSEV